MSGGSGGAGGQVSEVLSPTVQDQVAVGKASILNSPHVSQGPGRIANAPVPSVFSDDRGEIHRLRVGRTTTPTTAAAGTTGTTPPPTSSRGTRINVLHSVANMMRSGYLHPTAKRDFVLRGRVEVWTLTPHRTEKTVYAANQWFQIDPYVPHIFHFLEDSVLIEWWWWPEEEGDGEDKEKKDEATPTNDEKGEDESEGDNNSRKKVAFERMPSRADTTTGGDLQCWYYRPYRRIVDVHNSQEAPSMGRFQRLVPQDFAGGGTGGGTNRRTTGDGDDDDYGSGGPGGGGLFGKVVWWTTGFVAGAGLATAVCMLALGTAAVVKRRDSR